jgi:replicative DNA helicase
MDLTNLNIDRKTRRKPVVDFNAIQYGKVPPQAREMEEAVLGAIMLEKNALDNVVDFLKAECFYVDAHQKVYESILRLNEKNQPIDIRTVVEELRKSEDLEVVGGAYYITKLTNTVVSTANLEAHARIVLQKFIQREIIRTCGEILTEAFEDRSDALELLDYAEKQILQIGQNNVKGDMVDMSAVLINALKNIEENKAKGSLITGVPTGFPKLDNATRGWQPGDLIILAARPSVGKTAIALNIANAAANYIKNDLQNKGSVAVFSLEMKSVAIGIRLLSSESKIPMEKLQTGQLTDEEMRQLMVRGFNQLDSSKLFFDDSSTITLRSLSSKCRKLKKKIGLQLIIIDYLQLMSSDNKFGNREQEISTISRGLKNLAQELNVPIIALSQLSREITKSMSFEVGPPITALRESGAIEQDADMVLMLWGPTEEEILKDSTLINRRKARIVKQRNGKLKLIELVLEGDIQLFKQLEENENYDVAKSSWKKIEKIEKVSIENEEDMPF